MNTDFISHIIRDTFVEKNFTVIYSDDTELKEVLLLPNHSIGAFQLHSELNQENDKIDYKFWNIGLSNPHIQYGDVDLFVSINYNPTINNLNKQKAALQIKMLLKDKGKAFIVNPGEWASDLDKHMSIDSESITNIKRYSMFKNENVLVYENI
jgi:hypothetical protein